MRAKSTRSKAFRTHRERKEQYIKALEIEIARLREAFTTESATIQSHFRQSENRLREQQQENLILREILNSHGIPFEGELQQRKSGLATGAQGSRSLSPAYSAAHASPFGPGLSAPTSSTGRSDLHQPGYANGTGSAISGHSPLSHSNPSPGTHHSYSPPEIREIGNTRDVLMPDMPGVFEKEPQLGIDFILA